MPLLLFSGVRSLLLCMDEGVHGGREGAVLTRDMVRDATQQEVQALRRENVELKQLVAELSLEGHRLKKTAIPILHAAAGTRG